jgi:peptide/nickel transport system permease protein
MTEPRENPDVAPELESHEPVGEVHHDTPRVAHVEFVSFWDIARRQYRKNRPAMVALWCVLGLLALAVVAPLICLNVPYVMRTPEGLRWPLFERLFDRWIFPSGIDVFFNLILVLTPLWLLGGALLRALALDEGEPRPRKAGACGAGLLVLALLYGEFGAHEKSIFWHLLFFGALGIGVQTYQAFRARDMLPRARRSVRSQTRVALAGLFVVVFCLTLFWKEPVKVSGSVALRPMRYTNALTIYRAEIEKLEKDGGWAVKPPIFYHPDNVGETSEMVFARTLHAPSVTTRNYLGCDNNGRDVLGRILYGARISLTIGVVAVSIYVTIGTILGSIAGYFGGWVDMLIVGLLQVMLCIPFMFLLLTVIAVFETRSIFMVMVTIGLISWTGITRLVRGEFFRQRSIDYVVAAKALGIPERRIIFGHILKNAMAPVLVAAAFGVAGAILAESFLSFIGLGDPNAPSWGGILQEGRAHRKSWLILSPGIAIFFVVTVLNLVGDGLRDALDPKLRQ